MIETLFIDKKTDVDVASVKLSAREKHYLEQVTSEKRRQEFLRGRFILQKLHTGLSTDRSGDGSLILPRGLTGSISHSQGHVAGCLAKMSDYASVGIDIELFSRVHQDLRKKILTPEEERLDSGNPEFLALVFSAKEAIYKCAFPLEKRFFSFQDVSLSEVNWTAKTFACEFHFDTKLGITGSFVTLDSSSGPIVQTLAFCL